MNRLVNLSFARFGKQDVDAAAVLRVRLPLHETAVFQTIDAVCHRTTAQVSFLGEHRGR